MMARPGAVACLGGLMIFIQPDRPNYVLPAEVCPGVPWPPGFREDINAWSRDFLGTWNLLRDGEAMTLHGEAVHMNPRTYVALMVQQQEART